MLKKEDQIKLSVTVDYLIKIAAALSLPLLVWAVVLYDTVNLERSKNESQEKRIEQLTEDHKEVGKEISGLKVTIGRLEVKLDSANEKLSDIKSLFLQNNPEYYGPRP